MFLQILEPIGYRNWKRCEGTRVRSGKISFVAALAVENNEAIDVQVSMLAGNSDNDQIVCYDTAIACEFAVQFNDFRQLTCPAIEKPKFVIVNDRLPASPDDASKR